MFFSRDRTVSMAELVHFTLASDDVDRAQAFYSAVFSSEFTPVELGGETLYRGSLAGLGMVICPAAMADVVANRSRHQLRFEVEDVAGMLDLTGVAGGRVHTPLTDAGGRPYAVVCDPDNNTIEFVQVSSE